MPVRGAEQRAAFESKCFETRAKENNAMKIQDFAKDEIETSTAKPWKCPDLGELFDGHVAREFADHDVDATMATMIPEPYVHCVPVMTSRNGTAGCGARLCRRAAVASRRSRMSCGQGGHRGR